MVEYPDNWDEIRRKVYKRDNYTCQNCESRGGRYGDTELHAHHGVPLNKGGTNKLSNLTTYCRNCHKSIHEPQMAPTATDEDYKRNHHYDQSEQNNDVKKVLTEPTEKPLSAPRGVIFDPPDDQNGFYVSLLGSIIISMVAIIILRFFISISLFVSLLTTILIALGIFKIATMSIKENEEKMVEIENKNKMLEKKCIYFNKIAKEPLISCESTFEGIEKSYNNLIDEINGSVSPFVRDEYIKNLEEFGDELEDAEEKYLN